MPRLGVRGEEYRTYTQNFDEDIPGIPKRRRKHKIKTDHREVYHNDRLLTSFPRNSSHALLPCSAANHPYSAVTMVFFFYWRYNPLWVCILQPSSGL